LARRGDPTNRASLSHPGELKLGTAWLLEHQLVARKCHYVNGRRERRFYFDSILIAEFVAATNFSDADGTITGKFPNCLIFSPRHPPFADNAGIPTANHNDKQNCRSGLE
jgi:hypothetical protein